MFRIQDNDTIYYCYPENKDRFLNLKNYFNDNEKLNYLYQNTRYRYADIVIKNGKLVKHRYKNFDDPTLFDDIEKEDLITLL